MSRKYWRSISLLMGLFDIVVSILAFFMSYYIRNQFFQDEYGVLQGMGTYIWILWIIVLVWPPLFVVFKIYDAKLYRNMNNIIKVSLRLIPAVISGVLILSSIFYLTGRIEISRLFFIIFTIVAFCFLLMDRIIVQLFLSQLFKNKSNHLKVLVVTDGNESFYAKFADKNPQYFIDIVGYVKYGDNSEEESKNNLGSFSDLIEIIKKNVVDEVMFELPGNLIPNLEEIVLECESMGVSISMPIQIFDFKIAKPGIDIIKDLPVITFNSANLSGGQMFLKRGLDICGSFVGLLITAVIFPFIAIAIKLDSEGPIFFGQYRVGRNGRKFKFYKFRSMYKDAEARKKALMAQNEMNGFMFKMTDDPRITKVGNFLRKTSLDEFPQFFNIFRGDMSLVGTRPPTLDEVEQYKNHHHRRLSIKPGLTGMWQVSGRSEITDFDEVVRLDVEYIDNWSILLDIKILFKTVFAVVARKGSK